MGGGDYNVLLLRPQDIAHVIDIGKALHKVLALQNERKIETSTRSSAAVPRTGSNSALAWPNQD